jgi:hypothetical protein
MDLAHREKFSVGFFICTQMGNKWGGEAGGSEGGDGAVSEDVLKKELHRLLHCKSNDAVKLAFLSQEDGARIGRLDLTGLAELKRSEKGAVEVKLIDRIRIIELLDRLERERQDQELGQFLNEMRQGGET